MDGHLWGAGNGEYRGELKRALQVITRYATSLAFPLSHILVRLDGLYGNAAPLTDVLHAGLGIIARSKDYALLDLAGGPAASGTPARPGVSSP
jgi:hypothetical protein